MASRLFSVSITLISAFSMGFALPAHAENHARARKPAQAQDSKEMAQFEQAKNKLIEKLKKIKDQSLRIYDQGGKEVLFDEVVSNPVAFKEGVTIGMGEHKFQFRGELIDQGEKGIKIFVSHSASNGAPDSGQVITLSPEMTKKAIEQRFHDAIESLMITTKMAKLGKDGQRDVASANTADCVWAVVFAMGLVPVFGLVSRAEGKNVLIALILAVAFIAGTVGSGAGCAGVKSN